MKHLAMTLAAAAAVTASPLDLVREKKAERENELRQQIELEQFIGRVQDGWKVPLQEMKSRAAVPGATLTGRVVDEAGDPVDYFNLRLYDEYGHEHEYLTVSDSTGTFTFSGLYSGKYTVRENSYQSNWYGNTTDADQAQFITVGENGSASFGDIVQISRSSSTTNTILKATLLFDGKPLAYSGVKVRYADSNGDRGSNWTYTNGEGSIETELQGLEAGEQAYILLMGDSISPVWIDGTPFTQDPSPITLTDTITIPSLSVVKGGTISGKVVSGLLESSYCYFSVISEDGYEFGSDGASEYSDSTFTVSGLPAGKYYVKTGEHYGYESGFYPNNASLEDAQLIEISSNNDTTLAITLIPDGSGNNSTSDAYVVASITDKNGDAVESGDLIIEFAGGNSWWHSLNSTVGVPAGEYFKVRIESDKLYTAGNVYWNDGQDTVLAKGDTLFVNLTLGEAGRVAGDIFYVEEISEEVEFESMITLANDRHSYSDDGGWPFRNKYEIHSAVPGVYALNAFPLLWNESGNPLTLQPKGEVKTSVDSVTIIANTTTVQNLTGDKTVSGMISGTYDFNIETEWIYYAITPNGKIVSAGLAYHDEDLFDYAEKYHGVLYRDWEVWSALNSNETSSGSYSGMIDIPLLAAGEYYILILYWDENSTGDNIAAQWYGVNKSFYISEDELEDEFGVGNLAYEIPAGAKKVTLATDDTWIKGLDFGATPIADIPLKNEFGVRAVATLGKEIVMSYNFAGSDLKMNIYAANGRILASKAFDSSATSVQWNPNLATGTYLFEVVNGTERFMYKIGLK